MSASTASFPDIFLHDPACSVGNDPITRYMRLPAFLMLLEGKLFIPTLATLRKSDPFESNLPSRVFYRFHTHFDLIFQEPNRTWLFEKMPKWMRDHVSLNQGTNPPLTDHYYVQPWLDQLARRRCIWCWYGSPVESMAHWSIYGASGIAIESRPQMIRDALAGKAGESTSMGQVVYFPSNKWSGDERLVRPPLITRPYFVKSAGYEYEKEIRFVTAVNPDNCNSDESGGIIIDDIEPAKLLSRVIISPHIHHSEATEIKALIQKKLKGVPVEISDLLDLDSESHSAVSAFQKHFSKPFADLDKEQVNTQWEQLPPDLFLDV